MLKKLLILTVSVVTFAACNDNDDVTKICYATENTAVVNGHLTGTNMHFYGTAVVTDANGSTYTDDKATFEFAGSTDDFALYMHETRFAAAMPALEMRIYTLTYTPGEGAALSFSTESVVPQVLLPNGTGGGYSYQDVPSYTLTDVDGAIDGISCHVSFTCDVPRLGTFRMEYNGKLLIKK